MLLPDITTGRPQSKSRFQERLHSMLEETKQKPSDMKRYLESKVHAHENLTKLKLKYHIEDERYMVPKGRDPEFGLQKDTVARQHQFMKATPRANILQAARMLQTRVDMADKDIRDITPSYHGGKNSHSVKKGGGTI